MNTTIQIYRKISTPDDEGFVNEADVHHKTIKAYREGRHASERWANRATFTDATDLFRFRRIPNFKVTTDMKIQCGDNLFEITSIEDVKGRGMYIEVLAREVKPGG